MRQWKLGEVCEHDKLGRQCDLCFANDELTTFRAENERLKALNHRWNSSISKLTPGGSEYHDDPERCAAHILDAREMETRFARRKGELSAESENARLRADLALLAAECKAWRDAMAIGYIVVKPPRRTDSGSGLLPHEVADVGSRIGVARAATDASPTAKRAIKEAQ